jgi:hypothetical protein
MYTTINLLKHTNSCAPGYKRLCSMLRKFDWPKDDDHPIPLWMFILSGDDDMSDFSWVVDNSFKIERDEFQRFYRDTYGFVYSRKILSLLDAVSNTVVPSIGRKTTRDYKLLEDIGQMVDLPLVRALLPEAAGNAKKKSAATRSALSSISRNNYLLDVIKDAGPLVLPSVEQLTARCELARYYRIGRGRANEILDILQCLSPNEPIRYLHVLTELVSEPAPDRGLIKLLTRDPADEEVNEEECSDDDNDDRHEGVSPYEEEDEGRQKPIESKHPLFVDTAEYWSRPWQRLSIRERLSKLFRVDEKIAGLRFKNENKRGSNVRVERTADGQFRTATLTITNPVHILRIQEIIGTTLEQPAEQKRSGNVIALS